jgi:hypothetical protein
LLDFERIIRKRTSDPGLERTALQRCPRENLEGRLALRAPFDIAIHGQDGVQVTPTSTTTQIRYGNVDEILTALDETETGGLAFIFNVRPGLWTGTVTRPSLVCEAVPGGAPLSPGELVADVVAGAFSYQLVYCQ